MKRIVLALISMLAVSGLQAAVTDLPLRVTSPNGRIVVAVGLTSANEPQYSVTLDGDTLIRDSKMGFTGRVKFTNGIASYSENQVDETYTLPHGKRSTYRNCYHEMDVDFDAAGTTRDMTIQFRVFDDAVAFRFYMTSGNLTTYSGEVTEFNLAHLSQALALEYDHQYSWYYNLKKWSEMTDARGYCEPLLVETGHNGTYVLLTEASHYGQTAGNSIVQGTCENQFRLMAVNKDESNISSNITYPFASPWRTLIIGETKEIVETNVIQNLNEPSVISDESWIIPGRVSWNWGGEDRMNTGSLEVAKQYVDLAAYLGWEYMLLDDGWDGNINLDDFTAYCREKGIAPIVWFNNSKFSSDYNTMLSQFKSYANKGVKALKIDFFDNEDQSVMQKYVNLMKAAKECNLLLDFHGCTRPTGWERTYPNVMTMEAVCGGEYLLNNPHMNPANHSVNLVVGRNVVGAMDFTPTKLGQRTGSITHNITWSYNLALWTLFESGFQCMIDCPDNIINSPIEPALRCIPTAWDELKCIEAVPAQYATLARRSGERWFVATISSEQRTATIPLDFLDEGKSYTAYIYRDGEKATFDVKFEKQEVTSETELKFSVKGNGGATVILSPQDDLPYLNMTSYEAETDCFSGTKKSNDLCSGNAYKTGFSGSTRAVFRKISAPVAGEYAVTLYYLINDTNDQAYIQVGSGDKNYYTFHTKDSYDSEKGLQLAMKTVYVQLEEGTNTITYGNENGTAPDLDKITVSPTRETLALIDGISCPKVSTTASALKVLNGAVECHNLSDGLLSVYNIDGQLLEQHAVKAGVSTITLQHRGTLIISLNSGSRSFAQKVYIK